MLLAAPVSARAPGAATLVVTAAYGLDLWRTFTLQGQ